MHAQFIGEIICGGWNFCPTDWADCNGQLIPIGQYDALFALIGTTYGGDGQQTFALPNIQGRTMVHAGTGPGLSSRVLGEMGGTETVTLTTNQLPAHSHTLAAHTGNERSASPTGRIPGIAPAAAPVYAATGNGIAVLSPSTVSASGGSQPHNNLQPYLAMKCCISLNGIFPSRP
ncbi:MAG: phage tail protein [Comamonadaceae bacterium]|nr:phage tail protein [Comamonadaceae bacterium]